ncbi:cytochrome c maturation protein CcmE [Sphingomonas sp. ID0503]|uniref:cytochrome c maturation protein CcmE n=1 Tax=Sphingomonas sp. ID0503 TaxID=3399691 RepID=UPI003AFA6FB5
MTAKNQRLVLILLGLAAVVAAVLLAMSALKDQAAYFYSPADVARDGVPVGKAIRLGGMVADKSIKRAADGVSITFTVLDGAYRTDVRYTGITPDLFKENSGVVAEGKFAPDSVFDATTILAKHDERYMPPQLEGDKHKTETLEK